MTKATLKFVTVMAVLIGGIGYGIHEDGKTVTCKTVKDMNMDGREGIWEKCQSRYGSYYSEKLINFTM